MFEQWLPSDVLPKIQAMAPLNNFNGEDMILWSGDNHGKFTVGSANKDCVILILQIIVLIGTRFGAYGFQNVLGVLCGPFVMIDCLPITKDQDGMGSPMCDVCNNVIEDELHVLRDCPKAMALWLSVVHYDARENFFEGNLLQWISYNMNCEANWSYTFEWNAFWDVLCGALWNWRNKEKHAPSYNRPLNPKVGVMNIVNAYVSAERNAELITNAPKMTMMVGWKCPPMGWVKVGTDGARKEDGRAGCGGIIGGVMVSG